MRVRDFIPALRDTRVFHPLRNVYLRTFKRAYWIGLQQFFGQFVSRGSTVFDIGANFGDYTQAFLALGAGKVVAVEPTPHLVRELKRIRDQRLTVVGVAAGKERGSTLLNLSNFDTMNSVSDKWLERVAPDVEGHPQWIDKIEVEVSTLDELIQSFGMPVFIKIDVEGYELEVLKGLTKAPRFLSFEFHSELADVAISCLRQPCFPAEARFNYIIGEPGGTAALALAEWCDAEAMVGVMETRSSGDRIYGDIFVRCC
jgi:FkbM family methyltransferase